MLLVSSRQYVCLELVSQDLLSHSFCWSLAHSFTQEIFEASTCQVLPSVPVSSRQENKSPILEGLFSNRTEPGNKQSQLVMCQLSLKCLEVNVAGLGWQKAPLLSQPLQVSGTLHLLCHPDSNSVRGLAGLSSLSFTGTGEVTQRVDVGSPRNPFSTSQESLISTTATPSLACGPLGQVRA